MTHSESFKAARRCGVPIIAIETPDPQSTVEELCQLVNWQEVPVATWDIIQALRGLNPTGEIAVSGLSSNPEIDTANPAECLRLLEKAWPDKGLVFWHNAHRFLENEAVAQGIWNLRDKFKSTGATLVLMGPAITLPAELKMDALVVTQPLPNRDEIAAIVDGLINDAGVPAPDASTRDNVVDTLSGLSAFAAEQALAMSITKAGVNVSDLWERKRKSIEQTPGLSVWRGGDRFSDIGGCDNVKQFTKAVLEGRKAPRTVVFIDEIEKALAGAEGDTSGVSQDFLGAFLTWMQDREACGMIFVGPPGAAKSAVAKAAGNEADVPTVNFDLGAMKGSLVGQSEQRLRSALQVVDAVSQGRALVIATCNAIANLPPELRRRFTLGTFFFDLPTDAERKAIWSIYRAKYDIGEDDATPDDEGWTGAEIKQACQIAWRLNKPLDYAAKFIVPVCKSASEQIERLRSQANGRFIAASQEGIYQKDTTASAAPKRRKLNVN